MAFLNPWMLLALAGIASPVAIHLFNRFRPKTVQWAAMELLRKAMVSRSRQVRVEDLLLLILRCLAIALVALAMAKLTLSASGVKMLGGASRSSVVIAVDGSFSMEHRPGVASRFDQAMDRVRQILRNVEVGSPLSIMLMGQEPQFLLRAAPYDDQTIDQVLRKATALPEALNLDTNLDAIEQVLEQSQTAASEVYLVSDAQASTWGDMSDGLRSRLARLQETTNVLLVPLTPGGADNLAITDLQRVSGSAARGGTARYVATVRNFGDAEVAGTRVQLAMNNQAIDEQVLESVGPKQTVRVPLFARFDQAGVATLRASLDVDPLALDNDRYATTLVRNRLRILLVDGDPAAQPFDSETGYLATALQPRAQGGESAIETTVEPGLSFNSADLAGYDIVVLANVGNLRPEQVEHLRQFVGRGGGLMVFLGDMVQSSIYNEVLAGEQPLLPATLGLAEGETVEGQSAGRPMRVAALDHPVVGVIQPLPAPLLDQARIFRHYELQPSADAQVLLTLAGEDDDPLLVEKAVGRGRVLLWATAADRSWSSLPTHPVYPILLHQAVGYMTRQAWERPVVVGQPLVVPLPETAISEAVTFTSPQGESTSIRVAQRDGRQVAELPRATHPGVWTISFGEEAPSVSIAVNVDPAESDVAALADDQRAAMSRDVGLTLVDATSDLASAMRRARVGWELWWPMLLTALLCFVAESLLARRFSGRMKRGVTIQRGSQREDIREPEPDEQLPEAA